jgi:hypothetical protein
MYCELEPNSSAWTGPNRIEFCLPEKNLVLQALMELVNVCPQLHLNVCGFHEASQKPSTNC